MRTLLACTIAILTGCSAETGALDGGALDASRIDASPRDAGRDAAPRPDARVVLPDAQPARDAGADATSASDGATDSVIDAAVDASMSIVASCGTPPPPGAEAPAPLPTYAGTCPTLAPGANTIRSSGADREFLLVLPTALDPSERPPVIFMWHWLGGSASGFLSRGEVQAAADSLRFIAVLPEEKGDLSLKWPYLLPPVHSDARRDEELRFFDDMLACVADQFPIDEQCVSSAGVSAGALWTAQLVQHRSQHLSSFLSLSGGVGWGDAFQPVRPWTSAAHALPALVLWGGPTDWCGVSFDRASTELEAGLVRGGHYVVECVHNCAHAQPPIDVPPGTSAFAPLWRFALDHPYWLPVGASPWTTAGLPAGTPAWCAIGAGSASIRTGDCEGGALGDCT